MLNKDRKKYQYLKIVLTLHSSSMQVGFTDILTNEELVQYKIVRFNIEKDNTNSNIKNQS